MSDTDLRTGNLQGGKQTNILVLLELILKRVEKNNKCTLKISSTEGDRVLTGAAGAGGYSASLPGSQITMTVPSLEELDSFKYSDLQNLAKSLGLRPNLRAEKLLKDLKAQLKKEARKNENQDESQMSASSSDETKMQSSSQERAEREPTSQVTKARGRRRTVHRNPDSRRIREKKQVFPLSSRVKKSRETTLSEVLQKFLLHQMRAKDMRMLCPQEKVSKWS